jgi:glycerophosphoryl diester phosphodiesterase
VVFHDDNLKRLIGREERIIDLSLAEMQRLPLLGSAACDRPQTFSELLKQVAGRTLLQVELKRQHTPEATRALARGAAETAKDYAGPLVFESFDPTLIVLLERAGFGGARGIIVEDYTTPQFVQRMPQATRAILLHLLHYPWSRFDFISCEHTIVDLPAVRFFRGLGKPVTSWTIKSPDAAVAVKGKVDQIVFEGFEPGRA